MTTEHTPPAFTEAHRRRVDPDACACRVDDGNIIRCPLHAAAPKLLEALEAAWDTYAFYGRDSETLALITPDWLKSGPGRLRDNQIRALILMADALKACEVSA